MLTICTKSKEITLDFPVVKGVFSDDVASLNIKGIKEEDLGFGKVNKIFPGTDKNSEIVYLIGLGKKSEYSYTKVFRSFAHLSFNNLEKIEVNLQSFCGDLPLQEVASVLLQGIAFYSYQYNELKSQKKERNLEVYLLSDEDLTDVINASYNLGIAMNNTRDLVNKPYNYLNALDLAQYALDLADDLDDKNVEVKIIDKKGIEDLKMGAFLGVNIGSTCEPRLIYLSYNGNKESKEKVCLVGKGIMYDTGGYSLKQSMNTMKCDMAGAATVLGVFEAAVKNKLCVNLGVVICATDNRINGHALLPDDVVTAMNGKTIEIVSTDAEGRLTLADGICFAQKEGYQEVIDIATLTGGVLTALGDLITGVFSNDSKLVEKINDAASKSLELVWELPITEDFKEAVRSSKVADLTNSTGRLASSSSAAAFLEEFVEEGTSWMHLDIAGTAFHTSPRHGESYGATGAMVRTLYNYLLVK